MERTEKVKALKALIENGEYDCANVIAQDWDMASLMHDLYMTRYEQMQILINKARENAMTYASKDDIDMYVFWSNCEKEYLRRIERMTIAEAEVIA